jgi:alcohol dehydrogenase (cytochrome c)
VTLMRIVVGTVIAAAIVLLGSQGLLAEAKQSANSWPTYGFDYSNSRHVLLTQINEHNVSSLVPAWRYLTNLHGRLEASPIIVGDTMYITTGIENGVVALDAASGVVRWRYTPTLGFNDSCCGLVNRGVAVDAGRVFYATLDARLVALDAQTGRKLWDQAIGDPHTGLSETMAPLAWHGVVFIGSSGGELGVRGSFSAYRAENGRLLWRWWTVSPGWEGKYVTSVHGVSLHRNIAQEKAQATKYLDAWRHGGGPIWMTPALDERRSTIYLSTGNPAPVFRAELRPGDNLYTDSIVALDAFTGKMRWYYQETPHDPGDHDAASPPVLFDAADPSGRVVPAVGEASKTGWFYIVERDTGRFIRVSQSFVPQHDVYSRVQASGDVVRPGTLGGAIAPVSFDPELRLAFVEAIDLPQRIDPGSTSAELGAGNYLAGTITSFDAGNNFVCAVNVDSGTIAWQRQLTSGHNWMLGGTLSAGNLIFAPDPNGALYALDARNGAVLWQYQIGASADDVLSTFGDKFHDSLATIKRAILREPEYPSAHLSAPPVRYELNGREYIAIAADVAPGKRGGGGALFVFSLPQRSGQ